MQLGTALAEKGFPRVWRALVALEPHPKGREEEGRRDGGRTWRFDLGRSPKSKSAGGGRGASGERDRYINELEQPRKTGDREAGRGAAGMSPRTDCQRLAKPQPFRFSVCSDIGKTGCTQPPS